MNNTTLHALETVEDNPFEQLLPTPVPVANLASKSLYSTSAFGMLISFNSLSMLCSLISIVLIACSLLKRGRKLRWIAQPVSIRLTMYASVIDICYTLFRIYDMVIAQSDTHPNSQSNCKAAMFGLTFFALLSVFVRALFSVHLQAAIVHNVSKPLCYEKIFIAISLALALLLALLPLTRFAYVWVDYDPTLGSGHCSYFSLETIPHSFNASDITIDDARRAVIAGVLWCWATYFGWIALTILYCVLIIGVVIYHIWKEHQRTTSLITRRHQLLESGQYMLDENVKPLEAAHEELSGRPDSMLIIIRNTEKADVWLMAKKILRRVAQFPAIIVVCHALEIAWATATLTRIIPMIRAGADDVGSDLKQLYMGMQIMLALQGILTLLSLCFEPAVKMLAYRWHSYCCHKMHATSSRNQSSPQATVNATSNAINSMPWDVVTYKP